MVKKYKSTRCDLVTSSPTCPEQWDLLFQGIMGKWEGLKVPIPGSMDGDRKDLQSGCGRFTVMHLEIQSGCRVQDALEQEVSRSGVANLSACQGQEDTPKKQP